MEYLESRMGFCIGLELGLGLWLHSSLLMTLRLDKDVVLWHAQAFVVTYVLIMNEQLQYKLIAKSQTSYTTLAPLDSNQH